MKAIKTLTEDADADLKVSVSPVTKNLRMAAALPFR